MPGLVIDKVGGGSNTNRNIFIETKSKVESDYDNLLGLSENNSLVPGQKYLIANYLHKYLINQTDTSFIVESSLVSQTPYDYYTYFESGIRLSPGSEITIVSVPGWYDVAQIGDVFTISNVWGDGAHLVSGWYPTVGVGFSYNASRYDDPYIDGKVIKERFNSDHTGTLTTVEGSNLITGTGTLFTQEFAVGETISYFVDADYRYDHIITAINSDTEIEIGESVLSGDIATNAAIEKITFGKVIMQPGGLVNTDVHNGEAYSGMTAAENPAPQPERLVLTAISENNFSPIATSDTHPGDIVEYDFFDNKVFDLNGNVIATREGNVIRRKNEALKIDVNKDWRVQRYRRFRCNDTDWNRFKFLQEVYKLDSGSQVYQLGGINSLSFIENKRYLLTEIKRGLPYMDFTNGNELSNIFADGYQAGTADVSGESLYNTYYDSLNGMTISNGSLYTEFQQFFWLNFNEIECKDYFIIPIENNQPKEVVTQFKVSDLQDSIFNDLPKGQGVSAKIDVIANEINRSTALTGGYIRSFNEPINGFTSLEDFHINNSGTILNVINFSSLTLNNKGFLGFCQFGGAWVYPINFIGQANFVVSSDSKILGTIFGVGTSNKATTYFKSCICKDVLIKYFTLGNNTFSLNGGFFSIGNVTDASYGGNTWYQISATHGCDINVHPGFNRLGGIEYMFQGSIRDKIIKTDITTKDLYYEKIVDGNIGVELISSPLKRTDTSVNVIFDNATPIEGENVVITITASQIAANPGTEAIMTALLPDGYTFVSEDTGSYDNVTGEWLIGDLPKGTSKTLNITASVTDTDNYEVSANLTTKEVEITLLDNTASATIIPIAAINDLSTTIAVDDAAPVIGNNVIFTITGNNNGNKPATNVQATSLLPAGYTYVSDDSAASYDDVTGIWTVGSLAIAASDIINITATVEAAGPYQVDVSITGSEAEDLPVDNTDTITPVPTG